MEYIKQQISLEGIVMPIVVSKMYRGGLGVGFDSPYENSKDLVRQILNKSTNKIHNNMLLLVYHKADLLSFCIHIKESLVLELQILMICQNI